MDVPDDPVPPGGVWTYLRPMVNVEKATFAGRAAATFGHKWSLTSVRRGTRGAQPGERVETLVHDLRGPTL
jgi:hypothetical protein